MAEIDIPPGIVKAVTPKTASGRWIDCDHIRFVEGKPQKLGGVEQWSQVGLDGVTRALHSYLSISGLEFVGAGSHNRLFIADMSGVVTNITPWRVEDVALTSNAFHTTLGSSDVTVTHTAHGATIGTFVTFSGATGGGGFPHFNGQYEIKSVPSSNTYVITRSATLVATSTGDFGGAGALASYEINAGAIDALYSLGYGVGPYGDDTYGTPRDISYATAIEPRVWSLDNYGALLMGTYQGGTIYVFDNAVGGRAEPLTNAPTDCRAMFITEERFVFALCADMYVKWADRDDFTVWTPAVTNMANIRRLGTGSKLMAGTALAQGISLVWTNSSLYVFQFTGSLGIYDSRLAGINCGLAGAQAFTVADGTAFWMSENSFHMYSGYVVPIPRMDEIKSYVFQYIDRRAISKCHAHYRPRFREVWFHYPDIRDSGTTECSRYAAVNIDTWDWTIGTLEVTASGERQSVDAKPILVHYDGFIYDHDHDDSYDLGSESMPYYITSGWFIPGDEEVNIDVFGFAPDNQEQVGTALVQIFSKDRSQETSIETQTEEYTSESGLIDFRVRGRLLAFTILQDELGSNFRLGTPYVQYQVAGERR